MIVSGSFSRMTTIDVGALVAECQKIEKDQTAQREIEAAAENMGELVHLLFKRSDIFWTKFFSPHRLRLRDQKMLSVWIAGIQDGGFTFTSTGHNPGGLEIRLITILANNWGLKVHHVDENFFTFVIEPFSTAAKTYVTYINTWYTEQKVIIANIHDHISKISKEAWQEAAKKYAQHKEQDVRVWLPNSLFPDLNTFVIAHKDLLTTRNYTVYASLHCISCFVAWNFN